MLATATIRYRFPTTVLPVVVEVILITPAKDPTFNIYLKTLYKDQMRASAMEIFTLLLESFVLKLFYNFKILINKKYKAFQNSIFKLVLISRQQTGYYFQGGVSPTFYAQLARISRCPNSRVPGDQDGTKIKDYII